MKVFNIETPDEIIEKVNRLLKERGLWFESDGQEHDGYLQYELTDIKIGHCVVCGNPKDKHPYRHRFV